MTDFYIIASEVIIYICFLILTILTLSSLIKLRESIKKYILFSSLIIFFIASSYRLFIVPKLKSQLQLKYINSIITIFEKLEDTRIDMDQIFEEIKKIDAQSLNFKDLTLSLTNSEIKHEAEKKRKQMDEYIFDKIKRNEQNKMDEDIYSLQAKKIFRSFKLNKKLNDTLNIIIDSLELCYGEGISSEIKKIDRSKFIMPPVKGYTIYEYLNEDLVEKILLKDNFIRIEFKDKKQIYIYMSLGAYKSPIDLIEDKYPPHRIFNFLDSDGLQSKFKLHGENFTFFYPYLIIDIKNSTGRVPVAIIAYKSDDASIFVHQIHGLKIQGFKKWDESVIKINKEINEISNEERKINKFIFEIIGNMYL